MEQRPPKVLKLAWVEEEEEGLGAAPAEETEEVVRFRAQQEAPQLFLRLYLPSAALERTQEQDPTRGLFHRTAQVPTLVRYIHQWLLDNDSAEHRLDKPLLDLTEAQPADVVTTLLRVSPSCDRGLSPQGWAAWVLLARASGQRQSRQSTRAPRDAQAMVLCLRPP
ncbi:unnamed protein product [Coccothraustes coccothraustes]